jgi:hypothetical protein
LQASSKGPYLHTVTSEEAVPVAPDELVRLFARPLTAEATDALARRLADGCDWEHAIGLVAAGVDARPAWARSAPTRATDAGRARTATPNWRGMALGLALYVALRPVFGLGHQALVALVARTIAFAASAPLVRSLVGMAGLDPIYANAALEAIGGAQVRGVAVAGALGGWLNAVWPAVFLSPGLVLPGAGASMVAAPGAPAAAQAVATYGGDVLFLAAAVALTWWAWPHSTPLAMLGLLLQAQMALSHLLAIRVVVATVDASGLPFLIAAVHPGAWFTSWLLSLPSLVRQTLVGGTLVLLAYLGAMALVILGATPRRWLLRRRPDARPRPSSRRLATRGGGLAAVVAVATALSPIGALAIGLTNWQGSLAGTGRVTAASAPATETRAPHGPLPVALVHAADGSWQYLVDGEPTVIRGVGYNPQYASLDPTTRDRLYERDFATMHRLGINTVEGWFQEQFDETTLDAAARNDIGVFLPFELNQDWNYADPAVQADILAKVSAWVERYKDEPAVRMWAPGNEDLHRILYPNWVSKEGDPAVRARADAFAAFLPTLVDRIHALDPSHPVLYRDAEDVYLARLKTAFAQAGGDRPWLVYGANVYSPARLQAIVAQWPALWLGGPLVISEYGPSGYTPADRPQVYALEWMRIREHPEKVLGGLAYTWATNGPEQLDRVFGLVDERDRPVDGALGAISAAYLADARPAAPAPQRPGPG